LQLISCAGIADSDHLNGENSSAAPCQTLANKATPATIAHTPIITSGNQIKRRLQIHPKLRRGREDLSEPQRGVRRDSTGFGYKTLDAAPGTWIRFASAPAPMPSGTRNSSHKISPGCTGGLIGRVM
jgi:hypothetical protein